MNVNEVVVFDVVGQFAHFRSFDTNTSSLSHTFPPRTTVAGMIAAIIGRDKESYYEEFSVHKARIAVSILSRLKKKIYVENYLDMKKKRGHIQVPIEVILPEDKNIRYRIYFFHENKDVMEEVKEHIDKPIYPVYLGISEFIAKAECVSKSAKVEVMSVPKDKPVCLDSVVNKSYIEPNGIIRTSIDACPEGKKSSTKYEVENSNDREDDDGDYRYHIEAFHIEFGRGREVPGEPSKFIFEEKQKQVIAKLKDGKYYKASYKQNGTLKSDNILFMEGESVDGY